MSVRMDFSEQCRVIFEEVGEKVERVAESEMNAIAKETAQRIKTEARIKKGLHDTGEYASGWAVRKRGGKKIPGFTVYNRTKPGLTMLLEFGHVIRNAQGDYGRVMGIPHIQPAEKWAEQMILRRLNQKL